VCGGGAYVVKKYYEICHAIANYFISREEYMFYRSWIGIVQVFL